jgi:hypothetical protein
MTVTWNKAVQDNRAEIFRCWKDAGLSLFSGASAPSSLITETLLESMGVLLDCMADSSEDAAGAIDSICRILAVQPFAPSSAMTVFFSLRNTVSGTLRETSGPHGPGPAEIERFLSRTDDIILMAFDRYMMHREQLYKLKVEESRNSMYVALRRAGV